MDIDAIKSELDYEVAMQDAISDAGIPVCFVGVRALNYYNVRRSVREGYDVSTYSLYDIEQSVEISVDCW